MGILLSIIIPSYNMEDYLRRCLDTLIVQDDHLMELYEVLVINDGSTDSTSKIAHDYMERFPRTFKVIDKTNGHYGSCVNCGIHKALGKYIKILDADDWFDTSAFVLYLNLLKTTDSDMVITNYHIVSPKGSVKRKVSFELPSNQSLNIEDYCAKDAFANIQMHAVSYKKSILIDNNYCQTEGVPFTDQEWIFLPITYMNSFSYYPLFLYQYLVGREGQSMDPKIKVGKEWTSFELLFKRDSYYHSLKNSDNISNNKKSYLENKLKMSVSKIYRNGIIYKQVDNKTLRYYDDKLKNLDVLLYDSVTANPDKKLFGLKYVKHWRETGHSDLLTVLVSFILRFLL